MSSLRNDRHLHAGLPAFRRSLAPDLHFDPASCQARENAVERWVAHHLGSIDHERRVADVAASLFEVTWPLHQLTESDLHVLRLASIVHDVGRSVEKKEHPHRGARMVMRDTDLPLSTSIRRALGFLTRYHKGQVPDAGQDEFLTPMDDADRMRQILSLLRAADALDSRSLESPRLVFALIGRPLRQPILHVTCYLDEDCAKTRKVYLRRKKFRLFEELFDCQIRIEVEQSALLGLVA